MTLRKRIWPAHYHCRGDEFARQKQWAAAEGEYRAALAVVPFWSVGWNDLATVLVAQDKVEEAQESYAQIIHRFPEYAEAHYNWGMLLAKQGRYAEAIAQFQQVLHQKPSAVEAELSLSVLLAAEGKAQAAAELYLRAAGNDHAFHGATPWAPAMFDETRPLIDAQRQLDAASRAQPGNPALHALAQFVGRLRVASSAARHSP